MMKITNKKTSVLAALVLLIGLAAVVPAAAQMSDGRNDPLSKWKKTVIEHRVDKDKQFQISPTSPMAAASRLLIKTDPGQTKFLMLRSDSLKISADPGDGVQLSFKEEKDGKWTWESHAEGVTCSANGKPLSSGSVLTPGATMRSGVWAVSAYPSDKGLTLIVFDLQRPELKGFNGLLYFPPDRRFEVNATFEKFPTPKKVIMGTSRNLKKNFYRYARIRFKLDGKELQLAAYKSSLTGKYSDTLFIPYNDKSNGSGSYDAGRYLDIPEPKGAQMVLDFNFSYNPLCNYSDAYNCPIPPRENNLEVAINAGEKTYPH